MDIKNNRHYFFIIIGAISSCISIISTVAFLWNKYNITSFLRSINYKNELFQKNEYFSLISLLEVLFLLSALLAARQLITPLINQNKKNENVHSNLKSLYNSFKIITYSWVLIYLWLGISWTGYLNKYYIFSNKSIVWLVADFFHCITIIGFFLGFLVLTYPKSKKTIIQNQSIYKKRILYIYIVITACILTFSALGRFYEFGFDKLGVISLAFLSGISMQFFIGALDSIYFDRKRIILVPLYIYVQLQVIWVLVDGDNSSNIAKLIILITALICKIAFYLILINWRKRFLKYFLVHEE